MLLDLRHSLMTSLCFNILAAALLSVSCSQDAVVIDTQKAVSKATQATTTTQAADSIPTRVEQKLETADVVAGGVWADWLDAGACDAATGTKRQTRLCEDSSGIATDVSAKCIGENSRVVPCLVNGGWSLWVESLTCTNNTKTRTRLCNNPEPKNGGSICLGVTQESFACSAAIPVSTPRPTASPTPVPTPTQNPTPTPTPGPTVSGVWSAWTNVGACNSSTGLQEQKRLCQPVALGSTPVCTGPNTQSVSCVGIINGGWSDWLPKGSCSPEGLQSLIRHCDKPTPANGGSYCAGSSVDQVRCTPAIPLGERVLVLVDSALVASLATELNQFVSDLGPKARRIDIDVATEKTAQMKQRILEQHSQAKLAGVIAIGALPVANLYNNCDFDARPSTFKTDLFFTDINYTWKDANNDGNFESTGRQIYQGLSVSSPETPYSTCMGTGTSAGFGYHFSVEEILKPAFWMSRIIFWGKDNNVTSKINFYKQYFARNHAFRSGLTDNPKRGLNMVTTDWGRSNTLTALYGESDITSHFTPDSTGPNWIKEITTGNYEFAMPWVHSSPGNHNFPTARVYATGLYGLALKPLFYNLWACSAGNYSGQYSTLAVAYLANGNTLAVTSSSKSGSIMGQRMFPKIKLAFSLGESLTAETVIGDSNALRWSGGMLLFGDGSLVLR